MSATVALESLTDLESFRARRSQAWARNVSYWMQAPLRHVVDVGEYIADRTAELCRSSGKAEPLVVDMGCGSGWLIEYLLKRGVEFRYVGLDATKDFIAALRDRYSNRPNICFELVDLERPIAQGFSADVVVNAFSFFEFADIAQGFENAARALAEEGTLVVSTIDKTFLLLAISRDSEDFRNKLRQYEELPGIKFAFQPIDLGDRESEELVYPSVLYSLADYYHAAAAAGMALSDYCEHAHTAKPIPKIYCHLEFTKRKLVR